MIPAWFSFSSRCGHDHAEYNYVDYSHRNRETGRERSPAAATPVNHARKGYGPSRQRSSFFLGRRPARSA